MVILKLTLGLSIFLRLFKTFCLQALFGQQLICTQVIFVVHLKCQSIQYIYNEFFVSLFSDRHIWTNVGVGWLLVWRFSTNQEFPGYAGCQIIDCECCEVVPWGCVWVSWTGVRKGPWDRGCIWGPITIVEDNPCLVWRSRSHVIGKVNIESAWKIKVDKTDICLLSTTIIISINSNSIYVKHNLLPFEQLIYLRGTHLSTN